MEDAFTEKFVCICKSCGIQRTVQKGRKVLGQLISLFLLAKLSAEDIREREISVGIIGVSAFGAVLYHMFLGGFSWQEAVIDLLPGGMLVLISLLTGESIGYGDGAVVMILGLWAGGEFAFSVTVAGILLSGFYGGFCLLKRKKDPIPFVPFLLLGMEVTLLYA